MHPSQGESKMRKVGLFWRIRFLGPELCLGAGRGAAHSPPIRPAPWGAPGPLARPKMKRAACDCQQGTGDSGRGASKSEFVKGSLTSGY